MARIAGVNLPKEKRIEIALTAIYGIGPSTSKKLVDQAKINGNPKVTELSEEEVDKLRTLLEKYPTEGDLKRAVAMDIKHLKEAGTYRGFRHTRGLPTRGQRTRYNARTRKGKKKTIANKKQVGK
ncbi:30S ribosomal protein S13 [Candidatus Peregrinibacteria bacterium HGW-Peregrinibacteria-1]|jgi:small subunit ribosomal protein S13|nr:MAG: 30S ribosomal protein S13 [Candidatus Peregrinibacteria bacterium HGW-Peregrinibacteria-1]